MRYLILFLLVAVPAYAKTFTVQDPPQVLAGEPDNPLMQPRWSPDGSMIALTGDHYHGIQIYRFEDQTLSQLTNDRAAGFGMAWSPHSDAIVSRVARFDNNRRLNAIKLYEINRKNERMVFDYANTTPGLPAWDSQGTTILALINNETRLFSVSVGPAIERAVPNSPVPLVDGDQMIVVQVNQTRDGVARTRTRSRVLNAVRSPDGQKIAYEVYGGNMHVMNSDGSTDIDLGPGYRPRWHPDSEHLVYMITRDDGHRITESDLYTIRIDGQYKSQLNITQDQLEMNPDWSPDGKWIVYDVKDLGAVYRISVQENEEVER